MATRRKGQTFTRRRNATVPQTPRKGGNPWMAATVLLVVAVVLAVFAFIVHSSSRRQGDTADSTPVADNEQPGGVSEHVDDGPAEVRKQRPHPDAEMAAALAAIAERAPKSYPNLVVPEPEDGEQETMSIAELRRRLETWNPAVMGTVAKSLARRDKDVAAHAEVLLDSRNEVKMEAGAMLVLQTIGYEHKHHKRIWSDHPRPHQMIGSRFKHLPGKLVPLLKSDNPRTRMTAMHALIKIGDFTSDVARGIAALMSDPNIYVADHAMHFVGNRIRTEPYGGIGQLIPYLRHMANYPLPRGRGGIIGMVRRLEEDEQRKLIPFMLAHLDWDAPRDPMFRAGGQIIALQTLTKFKVKELIPRLPLLLRRGWHGGDLFDHTIKATYTFGTQAKSALPQFKTYLVEIEKDIDEWQSRKGINDGYRKQRVAHLTRRADTLRKLVRDLERM